MFSCIIIEDQAPAQRVLQKYIGDEPRLHLAGTFFNTLDAQDFLERENVDLLFLDIHLPRTSGMDFLRQNRQAPVTILTTAFSEYAVESYEYEVADYLVKPFSFDRFQKAVDKVERLLNSTAVSDPGQLFVVKSGHEYIRFRSSEVCYICTDMDYTEIHLTDKKILSSETLSSWEQQLEASSFIRIHKSYLVNLDKVEKMASNQLTLFDGTVLPIGRAFKEAVSSKWK